MSTHARSLPLVSAAGFATIFAAAALPHAALAQNGMPPGTRQWIELSANNIAPCVCNADKIGFVAAMPSPSPNYITDSTSLALGWLITAEAASTATSMRARYTRNFQDTVFLYNSLVDTYTITGPAGSAGQPVTASVTMTTTGELSVARSAPANCVGSSNMKLEIGTWNPNAQTEQFRVTPAPNAFVSRLIPFAVYGPTPPTLAINETLTTSFTQVVGTPFDVAFGYELTGGGANVASTLVWNLPPGFSISSVLGYASTPSCDSIDFNADGLFPDDNDLVEFLTVLAGGNCSSGNTCNDIDFNNDGLFPDDNDLIAFLRVLAGGNC
jgi:hypothetical protein